MLFENNFSFINFIEITFSFLWLKINICLFSMKSFFYFIFVVCPGVRCVRGRMVEDGGWRSREYWRILKTYPRMSKINLRNLISNSQKVINQSINQSINQLNNRTFIYSVQWFFLSINHFFFICINHPFIPSLNQCIGKFTHLSNWLNFQIT